MKPSQMLYRWRQGLTLDDIAQEAGLSRYQVYRRIHAERWRQGEYVLPDNVLMEDLREGLTYRQMADKHLCSVGCIAKKIKRIKKKTL
jgi:DNA-binding CsgD family transcriptional regulator